MSQKTNKLDGIQINVIMKLDSNEEHFFFQKLKSKKILIYWEPQNIGSLCDIKDNRVLFFTCGLTNWVIPPTSNKLQFQIPLFIIWLWGLKADLYSLAPNSADCSHSDVFQHPDILVIAVKMHHLLLPNFMVCRTCLFGRAVVGS